MNEDLKNNIIILALDNLISSYELALEDKETTQNKEDIELIQYIISMASEILSEYSNNLTTPKPEWNKL